MHLPSLNLEHKLKIEQKRQVDEGLLLQEVKHILAEDLRKEERIKKSLHSTDGSVTNPFNFDYLERDRIYHINTIRKICIDYRLRFLDSHFFKPEIPYKAICEIKRIEKLHSIELKGFKIMAPSKLMKLKNADDPLLFAPIGNGYYYFIDKWGNDLNPLRKWLYLPFKNINNILIFAILLSLFITWLVPNSLYDETNYNTQFLFLFLFIFKAIGFVIIFYGVSLGKNFNEQIWNSKYFNG